MRWFSLSSYLFALLLCVLGLGLISWDAPFALACFVSAYFVILGGRTEDVE